MRGTNGVQGLLLCRHSCEKRDRFHAFVIRLSTRDPDVILQFVNILGTICLCTYASQAIWKFVPQRWARRFLLGLAFGGGAAISMMHPLLEFGAGQVDTRWVFLAMAAGFGGWSAMFASVLMAMTMQWVICGMEGRLGYVLIVCVSLLSRLWGYYTGGKYRRSTWQWLLLVLITGAPTLLMLPAPNIGLVGYPVIFDLVAVFIFGKITEADILRRRRERELSMAAEQDALTGLPNRRSLMEFIATLETSERTETGIALLILDVDHFKSVNDRFGHAVGDDVLRGIGATLAASKRETDFAARYGGEEFVVLLQVGSQEDAIVVADRLRRHLYRRLEVGGDPVDITVSIGGAVVDAKAFEFKKVFERADAALYQAKQGGRNEVVFDPQNQKDM